MQIHFDIIDMLNLEFQVYQCQVNTQLYSLTIISHSDELNLAGVGSLGVEFIWGMLVNIYSEDSFPSSH